MKSKMQRIHYLAAEIFFYSYDNYDGHLGGNERFDGIMPKEARILDKALDGSIDVKDLASRLDVDEDGLIDLLSRVKTAREIVDAESPAEGFREAVRQSVANAVKEGLTDADAVDALVGQICYRVADLGFLLKQRGGRLDQYSEELRSENPVD
jgi:hypothetical protein